jgi:F-type H+-transporting ATPase subunit b
MEGAEHAAEGGAASFPPFDATLFPHQLFWFALSFIALYFVMSRYALPAVAQVIASREAATKTNLDVAASTSETAERTKQAAEQGAAAGRAKALALVEEARAAAQAEFAAEQEKVDARLRERALAAEARINDTRAKALAEIAPVADDLAKDIAARVSGGVVGVGAAR